jgi:hypothetical protein
MLRHGFARGVGRIDSQTRISYAMPMKQDDILRDLPARAGRAVAHYWATRIAQRDRQKQTGKADQGLRSAVTGGAQMDGFIDLFTELITAAGVPARSQSQS